MFLKRSNKSFSFLVAATVVVGLLWTGISGVAQAPQTYKARLSIVPISGVQGGMRSTRARRFSPRRTPREH